MALEFGKLYTVTAVMQKRHTQDNINTDDDLHRTIWTRCELKRPVPMMYIGKRTVHEGVLYIAYHHEDGEYQEFKSENRIKVFVFVRNENTNPVYVHPDDVTIDTDGNPAAA
jgi:hypothetical protein